MEKINKIVSLDKCRSHRTGLLPFVVFNGDDTINFVSENDSNGNYGGFVCDFKREIEYSDGVKEIYEVKYLDIMRYYNMIQDILSDVIYVSGVTVNNEKRFYPVDNLIISKDCGGEKNTPKSKYEYIPLDITNFNFETVYYTNDECEIGEYVLIDDFSSFSEAVDWWSNITDKFNFDFFKKGIWGLCRTVEENFLGLIEIDKNFDSNVPNFVYYTNKNEILNKYGSISDGERESFGDYLTNKIKDLNYIDSNTLFPYEGYSFKVPTIDIPIFLEDNTVSEKIYTPYMYSVSADGSFYVYTDECVDKSSFKQFTDNDLWVESKLSSLKSKEAYQVSSGLWGCFEEFSNDNIGLKTNFVKYTFNKDAYPDTSGFTANVISGRVEIDSYKCADGEPVKLYTNKEGEIQEYKNITILDCVKNFISIGNVDEKGSYVFNVKYDNSFDNPMGPPYKVGEIFNIITYEDGSKTCDVVSSITYNDSTVVISYVLGAELGADGVNTENKGIHYEETLSCVKRVDDVLLEGDMVSKLYYYDIDYDTNAKYLYNDTLKTGHYVRMAKITGMEVNNIKEYNYPCITTEGIDSLYNEPKYSVDIVYNRGAGAAWENHFKLSECNTLEDLENYGNNYFNI